MKRQRVIRTATPENGYWKQNNRTEELELALHDGFTVVMCNVIRRKDGQEWLEYILEQEIEED